MSWRCFGGLCQKALLANASTASLTGLRRFLAKPATSPSPESEQRLAGYADHPGDSDFGVNGFRCAKGCYREILGQVARYLVFGNEFCKTEGTLPWTRAT